MDAYVRVSAVGERGGDPAYGSPQIQRDAIAWWANGRNVKLARTFIEEDETAGEREAPRPKLEEAIQRALAGTTDGIAFYNISRFSRFTEQGLADARRLRQAGARLVFVSEGMGGEEETIDTRGGNGKLIFTILLAMQEAALDTLKAGWRISKARAIREGRQIGPTPVGFRRVTERNGRPKGSLVPDDVEGPAVAAAYEAVAKQRDLHAAIPILRDAIPNKRFTVRKAKSAERYGVRIGGRVTVPATWNLSTTRRLLRSPVYMGHAFYDDGEIATNREAHPPLIDGTTWRVVQRIIDVPDDAKRAPSGSYPLTRHAVCATCGGTLSGARIGEGRRAYRCLTSKRRNELRCERATVVSAEPLEAQVRALLVARYLDEEVRLEELMETAAPASVVADFGPEDLPATAQPGREAVRAAEQALTDLEALRDSMPEAAFNAALEAQDATVTCARDALAVAEAEASSEPEPPEAEEIAQAPLERLPEFLKASGLVVRVAPGRGRLHERVTLEPSEEIAS